jgi:hypothetical protein
MELDLFNVVNDVENCEEKEIEVCSICYEALSEKSIYEIKECNHIFHSDCLIQWFRSGNKSSCPNCRNDEGLIVNTTQRHNENLFKLKIKFSNSVHAPREFVKLVKKYEKLKIQLKLVEKNLNDVDKERKNLDKNLSYKEYSENYDLLSKKKRILFKKRFKIRSDFYKIRDAIELIPIKPVIIKMKKYNKKN